jgi:hypothetical protein
MPTGTRYWACAIAAALLLSLGAATARADEAEPDPGRVVVVLAFRTGAAELPDIDRALAELLRDKTSLEVSDVVDARGRYGNRLDGDVVSCAGDAACIADIGRKLGADEVLLVGISRFGDVILTLQRIDVTAGEVRVRIAEALALDAAPDTSALLEYLRQVMPQRDFLRFGVIRIQANIAGAEVVIDGERRGRTPLGALRVPAPGNYAIRITRKGYQAFQAATSVSPDAEVVVQATLTRQEPAWYRRWWVWAVVGGTVVAGTTAAVVLTGDDRVPVSVIGLSR